MEKRNETEVAEIEEGTAAMLAVMWVVMKEEEISMSMGGVECITTGTRGIVLEVNGARCAMDIADCRRLMEVVMSTTKKFPNDRHIPVLRIISDGLAQGIEWIKSEPDNGGIKITNEGSDNLQ